MNKVLLRLQTELPPWAVEWLDILVPLLQVVLILLVAWGLYRFARRVLQRIGAAHDLPAEFTPVSRRIASTIIFGGAVLWALERIGVSSGVLWAAFTSFAAVGAVAFFAAWSVLSNIFCALLIFTTRMFRLYDVVEVLENGDKQGLMGRVIDINLVYTTLEESGDAYEGTTLQVPNSIFFQRVVRRWHGPLPQTPATLARASATTAPAAPASTEPQPAAPAAIA